ncbi:hypothetical protein TrLO_g9519 [Triparma laevis f. longispina]|uniref:Phosphotyrosine protein phosphatase I domain-containing protein n=1 Tax=Triparma laevis f. longispina TaxID=1714387 RepID=A0A9W7C7S4_9STRA|nr:hypothetical protein TrLO_g9519 [Triparma laevis f. longispina]
MDSADDIGDILFICGRNTSRSKLAEAFALSSGLSASSCGLTITEAEITASSTTINPRAITALSSNYSINIPLPAPRSIDALLNQQSYDHVILLCDCLQPSDSNKVLQLSRKNSYEIWNIVKPSHTKNGFEVACKQIRGEMGKLGWL